MRRLWDVKTLNRDQSLQKRGLIANAYTTRAGPSCVGHPRLALLRCFKDVDARHKAGHDECRAIQPALVTEAGP
jgi:hypothetical protein